MIIIVIIYTNTTTTTTTTTTNNNNKANSNLPPQGKSTPTTSQTEPPLATAKEQEPATSVGKTSNEAAGILDSLHYYVCAT